MGNRYVLAGRIDLGLTRIAGYILYNPSNNCFEEKPPRETMHMVKSGLVLGLKLDEKGEIALDEEWAANMKIRSGVGKYRDLNNTGKSSDRVYSVVRVINEWDGPRFEIICNKCSRTIVDKKDLENIMIFSNVGGVKLNGDEIIIHPEIYVENQEVSRFEDLDEIVDVGGTLMSVRELFKKVEAECNSTESDSETGTGSESSEPVFDWEEEDRIFQEQACLNTRPVLDKKDKKDKKKK